MPAERPLEPGAQGCAGCGVNGWGMRSAGIPSGGHGDEGGERKGGASGRRLLLPHRRRLPTATAAGCHPSCLRCAVLRCAAQVVAMLDAGLYDMRAFKEGGWLDDLKYEDEINEELKPKTGG